MSDKTCGVKTHWAQIQKRRGDVAANNISGSDEADCVIHDCTKCWREMEIGWKRAARILQEKNVSTT